MFFLYVSFLTSPSNTGSLGGRGLIHWGFNPSKDKFLSNPSIVSSLSPDPILGITPGRRSNLKFGHNAVSKRINLGNEESNGWPGWIKWNIKRARRITGEDLVTLWKVDLLWRINITATRHLRIWQWILNGVFLEHTTIHFRLNFTTILLLQLLELRKNLIIPYCTSPFIIYHVLSH